MKMHKTGMEIVARYVLRAQMSQYLTEDFLNQERTPSA